MNLDTALASLDWLPPQRVRQLERFGLRTAGDLLGHFPRRHEDRTQFDRFPQGELDRPVCVCGVVKRATLKRLRGRMRMFDVVLEEDEAHVLSPTVLCRWFNSPWVEKMILEGQRLVVYGKPKASGANIVISHPEFEVVEEGAGESIHLNRITPIHRATEGLSPRVLRQIIWDVLEHLLDDEVPETLPKGLDPVTQAWALRQIHFPENAEALARARRHLVLEEFFAIQLSVATRRAEQAAQPGAVHAGPGLLMRRLHEALPFGLTGAQQRAIGEIAADLAAERPMNRLLHGDVGSGKTLVALSAMLLCVESGFQAAIMAPTQILAEQHYLNFRRLLEPLGVAVALRTGNRREDTGSLPLFANGNDGKNASYGGNPEEAQILVGTHALLYEGTGIRNLGLAVIDEQHKFGVLQRARLREHGAAPDVLVMTATPIPRTLTMTLYGDLEVSTLDELPKNRGKIITAARPPTKLPDAIKFMREQLEQGRQAYVLYPLIDESEKLEAKAAAAEFDKWRQWLAPLTCELLHGRIPAEEKDAIMERFRSGQTKVLVATTVIEVGIDVPNASLMLVENAERFGLAQLHQLRGRVGRGEHKSYCILLSSSAEAEALEKLSILEKTSNGFEIAEADLRLRGPGDLFGTAQSGLPPLRIGDILADQDLMRLARQAAFELIEKDPTLARPEHAQFRRLLIQGGRGEFSEVS